MQPSQVQKTPRQGIKIGLTPVIAAVLTTAVAGTFFGTNLVNDRGSAGVVAVDRALAVMDVTSTYESGSTTNTIWLNSPFDADALTRGYKVGSGVNVLSFIDIVANPTGASFDCYLGKRDSATGAGIMIAHNKSVTGTIIPFASGSILGPTDGIGCNTTSRIKSNTLLKAGGVTLRSAVLN